MFMHHCSLRNRRTNNGKFETDKNKSILTCFVVYIFSKGIRSYRSTDGFLAFDIVHAVEFSRIGRSWPPRSRVSLQGNLPFVCYPRAFAPGNLSNLAPSLSVSNRAEPRYFAYSASFS